jgi:ACS family hexuronate transporter-like MFS transporter
MRFLLGMGEGGAFPAATRVVAEWIPDVERATAMGFINAGTAIGALLAPPLIGIVLLVSGWRAVFFVAGGIGLAWVLWWFLSYRGEVAPSIPALDARAAEPPLSFREIIGFRSVQTLVFAKFMSDSAWFFLRFWLPKYLYDARSFDIRQVSYYAWIPYAASGVGSFLGGWFSSRLLHSGRSLDLSRKLVLGINAIMMPVVMLVPLVPVNYALLLFSMAFFSQQSWSGLIMTIPADVFPLSAVGTVSGLVGFGGSAGGAIFGLVAGALLGRGFGYGTLFVLVGTFHLIGFLALLAFGGRIQPRRPTELLEIESHE